MVVDYNDFFTIVQIVLSVEKSGDCHDLLTQLCLASTIHHVMHKSKYAYVLCKDQNEIFLMTKKRRRKIY